MMDAQAVNAKHCECLQRAHFGFALLAQCMLEAYVMPGMKPCTLGKTIANALLLTMTIALTVVLCMHSKPSQVTSPRWDIHVMSFSSNKRRSYLIKSGTQDWFIVCTVGLFLLCLPEHLALPVENPFGICCLNLCIGGHRYNVSGHSFFSYCNCCTLPVS